MGLGTGVRLGPYEIVAAIGAGGMGEVYKARDTRLDRPVAIKMLSPAVAADPDLRHRFEREARAISGLSHTNVCPLFDVGEHAGTSYIVMEFLEGETLARRLERGPLPPALVVRYAIEIASALDHAHRHGIIHRDLKPANVMLTPGGVKLLDFGLAKVGAAVTASAAGATPTVAADGALTAQGTILGTFHYMSPEQIEGKDADARSDIFAFGAVLYEMATGRKAFDGKSHASVMGAILERDPDPILSVRPGLPPALDRVVKICLAKDPDDRFHAAHDLLLELRWIAELGSQAGVPATITRRRRRVARLVWTAALIGAAVLGGAAVWLALRLAPKPPQSIVRASLRLNATESLALGIYPPLAISPDGRHLVYVGVSQAQTQLFIRALDSLEARAIPGTESAQYPFFAPDGQWIGFLAGGRLRKMSLNGGAPVTISDAVTPGTRGIAWGDDGNIFFTPTFNAGLYRVSANGGTPVELTRPAFEKREKSHRWPEVLPGSKALLFMTATADNTTFDEARIEVLSLETGERRVLVEGGMYPRYLPTGHLLYVRAGSLLTMPFDAKRLTARGAPVIVARGILSDPSYGYGAFGISATGSLVHAAGVSQRVLGDLLWVDRLGSTTPVTDVPREPGLARLSPDGRRVLLHMQGATDEVWVLELSRGTLSRVAFGWDNQFPIWTPDGRRVTFASSRLAPRTMAIFWQPWDGTGQAEMLTSGKWHRVESWTPDGRTLALTETDPKTRADIWLLDVTTRKLSPLLVTPANEGQARFSPDGRWLAYTSNESGRAEIYVRPYPGPGPKIQVSPGGGTQPLWSRDGQELVYRSGNRTLAVKVVTTPEFDVGAAQVLFERPLTVVDVTADGRRFLALEDRAAVPINELTLVVNWAEELRRVR